MRIAIFHDTPEHKVDRFVSKIKFIKKYFQVLEPDECLSQNYVKRVSKKTKVLITFDDGFQSNYSVAFPILEEMRIKAIFFVVPDFVDLSTKPELSNKFVRERFYPGGIDNTYPQLGLSMNWQQIQQLSSQGHEIGSHSLSHADLASISIDHLESELVASSDRIERKITKKPACFAFPFGTAASIGKVPLQLALDNYRAVFSGVRGTNTTEHQRFYFRDGVNLAESSLKTYLGLRGVFDWRYVRQKKILYQSKNQD